MYIYQKIYDYIKCHGAVNVVIAGQSCSGKTTLAKSIQDTFKDKYPVAIMCQDDYFKNLPDIPVVYEGYLMDVPDAFWIDEFRHDVRLLLQYGTANIPNYDIATNTRISKDRIIHSGKINVFEGLHTIHILGDLENCIRIFLNTNPLICLNRRIVRDERNFKIPEKTVRKYWNECIQPMSERFIFSQQDFADIIV